jgi:hypothetical protein
MALSYTAHAQQRLQQRGISQAECEAAVANDTTPWRTKLKAGDHYRCQWPSSGPNCVSVITDLSKQWVITAFKGDPGGWGPESEDL